MPDYRQLNYGEVLPPDFLEALQQFIGPGDYNFRLDVLSTSVVQVAAGTGNGQVGLGINGLWRYITAPANTSISGAAGVRDICAVCGPNVFAGVPEVDSTNYAFTLQAPVKGVAPTVPTGGAYRKVGEVDWSGTAITALRSLVGGPAIDGLPGSPTLRTIGSGAQQAAAGNDPRFIAEVLPGDLIYSAAATRVGAVICDGASYLRATYPALFAAISTTYGSVDGSHFSVPDYRGKTILGAGTGAGLIARSRGQVGGEEAHGLSAGENAPHNHFGSIRLFTSTNGYPGVGADNSVHLGNDGSGGIINYEVASDGVGGSVIAWDGGPNSRTKSYSLLGGNGDQHNNMQPWGVASVFIKT